jgi:hypothetical protein
MAFKTILLQGEHYALGVDTAISIGYNMKGQRVICKSVLCLDEDDNIYCLDGGIRIKVREEELQEYYPNTPENRKMLKQMIAEGKA